MRQNTESKLQNLEDEVKALKSTYTISGGMMKTYFSYSDEYIITSAIDESPVKLKFTPSFSTGTDTLVLSFFIEQTISSGENINMSQYCIIEEQSGNGVVFFTIPLLVNVSTLRVGLVSTVPGTFSRIM